MSSIFEDVFYDIPGYSGYAINPAGIVLNKKQNTFPTGGVNPAGYVNYRLLLSLSLNK